MSQDRIPARASEYSPRPSGSPLYMLSILIDDRLREHRQQGGHFATDIRPVPRYSWLQVYLPVIKLQETTYQIKTLQCHPLTPPQIPKLILPSMSPQLPIRQPALTLCQPSLPATAAWRQRATDAAGCGVLGTDGPRHARRAWWRRAGDGRRPEDPGGTRRPCRWPCAQVRLGIRGLDFRVFGVWASGYYPSPIRHAGGHQCSEGGGGCVRPGREFPLGCAGVQGSEYWYKRSEWEQACRVRCRPPRTGTLDLAEAKHHSNLVGSSRDVARVKSS